MNCRIHAPGTLELYFYGELEPVDRAEMQAHVRRCPDCRQALEDLSAIRGALGARRDVAEPPDGDWTHFMARLDAELGRLADDRRGLSQQGFRTGRGLVPYFAMAALLALVTISVLLVNRARSAPEPRGDRWAAASPQAGAFDSASEDAAFVSLSGRHFQRSKLVVLGLMTRDPAQAGNGWEYERDLAATLLHDTRLYRLAAEDRRLNSLAGVLRDLEWILLETSMSPEPDAAALEQLQQLIRRRDLLTKMNVVHAGGF